jgi:predicted DNA-binding protein (MmcQ/YjbR family)
MHLDTLLQFAVRFLGTEETFPFDNKTLVLKVGGKMYLLVDVEQPTAVNLKCDPERAIELRERYDGIQPGYHMNKKHWNTIDLQGSVDEKLILELVKHSYELVLASLPKKVRDEFAH